MIKNVMKVNQTDIHFNDTFVKKKIEIETILQQSLDKESTTQIHWKTRSAAYMLTKLWNVST